MHDIKGFHTVRGYQLLEQQRKSLTPAMEDYLEMIYRITLEEGYVRVHVLSEQLHVQPPSTTKMVQKLAGLGFLDYRKHDLLFLTSMGRDLGAFLFERHRVIATFLQHLGVTDELLIETELIEHSISPATLNRLALFNRFVEERPDVLTDFESFAHAKTVNKEKE